MQRSKTSLSRVILTGVLIVSLLAALDAQDNQLSYLSQKLMLENSIRERITVALEKLLDDTRFVVDVKAEVELTPVEQTQTIIKQPPTTPKTAAQTTPSQPAAGKTPSGTIPTTQKPTTTTPDIGSLPLPGFEFTPPPATTQPTTEPTQKMLTEETKPVTTTPTEEQVAPTVEEVSQPVYTTQVQKYSVPVPVVKRLDINIILEDGISPDMIENVRQVAQVAAHFDRARGDAISIMTASFKKKKEQDAAEAVILKSIAEKIDDLERKQTEAERAARIEQQKRLERQAIVRDSLRVEELKRQIAELQAQMQAPQVDEQQRRQAQEQQSLREQEINALREQLRESNRRLQELELSSIETTPPGMWGVRNWGMWVAIAAAVILFLVLLIVLLVNRRRQIERQEMEWGYGSKIPLGPRPPKPAPEMVIPKPTPPVTPPPAATPEPTPVAPPPPAPTPTPVVTAPPAPPEPPKPTVPPVDIEAQREEMKSMKQSVISMAVGQPDTATRIIDTWLSESPKAAEGESEL
jgi:flagellar biosynthesis/type III secretory pathway M-ring protein FliF/YscJ